MSEMNPHIVKEAEGEAYTIQRFVTGKPLTADEMLPDEHGVYPVSPLGFLMSEDGVPLTSAPPTEMVVTYPIYDANGNEITPENPDINWSVMRDDILADTYEATGKYEIFQGNTAVYRVFSLNRPNGGNSLHLLMGGILPIDYTLKFFFINATSDDYTPTGILSTEERILFELVPDSINVTENGTFIDLDISDKDVAFNGFVAGDKLYLGVVAYNSNTGYPKKYILVDPSNGNGVSGLYLYGETPESPYRRVFTYETLFPPVVEPGMPKCNSRNGYSNREVAEWVEGHVSPIIRYGLHPHSEAGALGKAGAFVRWFASCGKVDISDGGGNNPVMVQGFGLGAGYTGECSAGSRVPNEGNTDAGSVHKELVFGYGTKHNALQVDVGKTALPLDWPFTDFSNYKGAERENNITFIRHGVTINGEKYGALERESTECPTCRGTGLVGGNPCPDCGGTGECPECEVCNGTGEVDGHECENCKGTGHTGTTHVVMDRMHVCLFNDFRPSDTLHGHVDGTTVLKKTFINLATPINTKDGEEFQVTVSLPNTFIDSAFTGNDVLKNLNGYYAFISQPRVFVVSGTWKFSETLVTFTIDRDMQELTLDKPLLDKEGNELPSDTAVRMKLSFGCYPAKKFSVTGTVDGTTVTLDEPISDTALKGALAREAMRVVPRSNSACGAAYVEPNNETLPEGIENLGLNAVRNENGALGVDNTGDDGNYNKVYNARGEHGRPGVLYESDGTARKDQRQIIATVYPTVTNTFPWALTHRRKLNVLDRLMTMDADAGIHSLYARIFKMNQDIVNEIADHLRVEAAIPAKTYPMEILSYTDGIPAAMPDDTDLCSFIGAVLKVGKDAEQPVAQARRAAAMLAEDYRNARVKRDTVGSLNALDMLTSDSPLDDSWNFGTPVSAGAGMPNEYDEIARSIRLRSIPPILSTAGTSPSQEPDSPILHCFPFQDLDFSFYAWNPYEFGLYDSDAKTEEVPCEIADKRNTRAFAMNSIVDACLKTGFHWLQSTDAVNDLMRSAELAAVDMQNEVDLLKPHGERGSGCGWMEAIDAFTKIVSPDNIPVPQLASAYDYSDIDDKTYLTSGDAYGRYRLEKDVTGERFIATDLPTNDALAMFLKDYVPSYAATLPKRNWDSWRVVLPQDVGTGSYNDEPVYQTRAKWNPLTCDPVSRGKYAADGIFVGSEFNDPNMNRIELDDTVSVDVSTPPYTCESDYAESAPFSTETDKYAVSYIRVFMKFTFSADAGRWYCTDYRQAPVSYLSPLYGAKALEEKLPYTDVRIWNRSACGSFSWRETTRHLYSESAPMEINADAIEAVMGTDLRHRRLATPYNPVFSMSNGKTGLGLSAPLDKKGDRGGFAVQEFIPHANFWSVYEHIRPVVSVIPKSDIPKYYKDSNGVKHYEDKNGIMSDAVLWGQYEYPEKRKTEYHLPDTQIPDADLTMRRLVYAQRNNTTGVMDTGDIQVGSSATTVLAYSNGESRN